MTNDGNDTNIHTNTNIHYCNNDNYDTNSGNNWYDDDSNDNGDKWW